MIPTSPSLRIEIFSLISVMPFLLPAVAHGTLGGVAAKNTRSDGRAAVSSQLKKHRLSVILGRFCRHPSEPVQAAVMRFAAIEAFAAEERL
jgi:hypothetical protein